MSRPHHQILHVVRVVGEVVVYEEVVVVNIGMILAGGRGR